MHLLQLTSALAAALALCAAPRSSSTQEPARDTLVSTPRRLQIGRFRARAILQCSPAAARGAVLAIVIPGTGGHGPEEAMPGTITRDGKETQLLTSFAQGLRDAGFHTLQLGKPGIEYHTTWDMEKIAYDKDMFLNLHWKDLIENANEAIAFASSARPCAATTIVLVGHSEGTQRIADVAAQNAAVRGLVFLGFHGHGFKDMVEWQAYRRPIELFVSTEVDSNHDGVITRDEADKWPKDFTYAWKAGERSVTLDAYAATLRANGDYTKAIDALAHSPLYADGIWSRAPNFADVARLPIPLLAFTGDKDVMTPPSELKALKAACDTAGKRDCETHLVPGLGHGMSAPRGPRGQPLLDQTEGPVDPAFLMFFTKTLVEWRQRIERSTSSR